VNGTLRDLALWFGSGSVFGRTTRLGGVAALVAAGLACTPTPSPDSESTDPVDTGVGNTGSCQTTGRLIDGPFLMSWAWGQTWREGNCTEFTLRTSGVDVTGWKVELELSAPVTKVTYLPDLDEALLQIERNRVFVEPLGASDVFAADAELELEYCGEPRNCPVDLKVTADEGGDSSSGGGGDNAFVTLDDPTGKLGLVFDEDGVENGGTCFIVKVLNLTTDELTDWTIQVQMADAFAVTFFDDLRFIDFGSDGLKISPDADSGNILPLGAQAGRVCLDPKVLPVAMVAQFSVVPPEED
jgi:hypothetical protein